MPQINILPKHLAELIAAGEVVERPASIVKEIMENAIDAGADKITLEIQRGGVTYIRITDNGCGIDRENVRKAFISHATSKIANENDLNAILTLGFRGEALASIAAVSRVEMMTRAKGEEIGTRYCIEGGEEMLLDDAGCPEGTTLIVRDIFYNTPARMKFLKKDVTEANAVAGVVDRIALSHPEVSIRFIRDGKDALFTTGDGKLESAVYSVLGKEFASTLIPAEYELEGIRVSGFISKPFNARPNRTMQFFFLNNRFIKTRTGLVALEEAYKNQIMAGKFPACVLNIQANAQSVDVNVHPAKTEVRFANEKLIFNAIYYCAKSALTEGDSRVQANIQQKSKQFVQKQYMPQPVSGKQIRIYEQQLEKASKEDFWQKTTANDFRSAPEQSPKEVVQTVKPVQILRDESVFKVQTEEVNLIPDAPADRKEEKVEVKEKVVLVPDAEPEETKPEVKLPEPNVVAESEVVTFGVEEEKELPDVEPYRVIGEAFKTYILVEQGEKLLLIDKHAAHERMLFEKYRASQDSIETQMLLVPVTVTLSKEEYSAVLDNLEVLQKAGYSVEDFGNGMVILSECPTAVADSDLAGVVMELAGYLADNRKELIPEKLDWIYHSTACRAAIKAGHKTTTFELNSFVEKLLNSSDIRYCPHGRPVLIELTKYDIEKNFGRV
ncbi:MAG: DNA mismatch repair endonuclease MutL [Clostridia bacterium]|nr:DNA mismatch repair endonuclease MutL [Clostridia bacterium]